METVYEFWALALPNVSGIALILYLLYTSLGTNEHRLEFLLISAVTALLIRANVGKPHFSTTTKKSN